METRHIKMEHNKVLLGKKQVLTTELELLRVLRKIRNCKLLRKKENTLRNKIDVDLASARTKLNLLFSTLPEDQIKKVPKEKIIDKRKSKEKRKFDSIEQELEEIKKKLGNLR
jgi:hypothetical protein